MNAISPQSAPAVIEAEQCLLGAIMANNAAYERVGSFLQPEHFLDPVHAMLYRRMAERISQGRPVDALMLKAELEHDRMLEAAGGTAYLAQLLSSMISIVGVAEYGVTIRDAWARREMLTLFDQASRCCTGHSNDRSAQQVATDLIASLTELAEPSSVRPSLADAAATLLADADAAFQRKSGHERLDVGLPSVDRLLGGLWPGNLYLLTAAPRTGKSSILMQMCRAMARSFHHGEHIHLFSLEMPQTDVLRISIAAESRWTARQIRSGDIGDAEAWMEFGLIAKQMADLPIIVDDQPADIASLRLRARQVQRTKKTRLIVVDHLRLINRDATHQRLPEQQWMPLLTQRLKTLAKELNLPILVLCQVVKGERRTESRRPVLNDLPFNDGGDADEVHALYRRELDMPEEPPGLAMLHSADKRATAKFEWEEQRRAARGAAEWIVLKSRFGDLGMAHLRFDGPRQLFREAVAADTGLTQEEADMFTRGEI